MGLGIKGNLLMRWSLLVLLAGLVWAPGAWAQTQDNGLGYDPDRHIEAPGQGAQDPARAEVMEGRSRDMPRCLATLLARRETRAEAQQVCDKILHDLGE